MVEFHLPLSMWHAAVLSSHSCCSAWQVSSDSIVSSCSGRRQRVSEFEARQGLSELHHGSGC